MGDSNKNANNIPAEVSAGMFSYFSIIKLIWPLALGMINNALMQFADRAYLAHHSMGALEAVLPAGMLMWIFAGFFQSIVGYSNVFVGQYHGAGDKAKCRATYRVALLLALVAGLISLPIIPLGRWILAASTDSTARLSDEWSYFTILMAGSIAVYVQTAASAYFTGVGKTRLIFWVNLVGNVFNIALDPILIFGWWGLPALGIAGAAYATIASMMLQAIVLVLAIEREFVPFVGSASREEMGKILLRLLRFGMPYGFYMILNMLSFTIFVFVTGGVGAMELAVSNACFTVNYLLIAPMEGFSMGASTLVAQAIGGGRTDLAWTAARRCTILGVGFVAFNSLMVVICSKPIISIFASQVGESAADFHSLGFILLIMMAAWQVFDAADIIISGALKGAGDTKFVMTWMLVNAFVLWLPLVAVVRAWHNTMPYLWSTMIAYVLILAIGSYIRWYRGKWRNIKLT